jgi:hypothetical protein
MNGSEKVDAFIDAMLNDPEVKHLSEERPDLADEMRRGTRAMALCWRKALGELFNETGEPVTLQEIGQRAGMSPEEYVVAAALSDVLGMSERVEEWGGYVPVLG